MLNPNGRVSKVVTALEVPDVAILAFVRATSGNGVVRDNASTGNVQLLIVSPKASIDSRGYSLDPSARHLTQVGDACPSSGFLTPETPDAPVWILGPALLQSVQVAGTLLVTCIDSTVVQVLAVSVKGKDNVVGKPDGSQWVPAAPPLDPGFYGLEFVLLQQSDDEGQLLVGLVEPRHECPGMDEGCVYPPSLSGPKLYEYINTTSFQPVQVNPASGGYVRGWSADGTIMVTTTANALAVTIWERNANNAESWIAVGQSLEGWPTVSGDGRSIATWSLEESKNAVKVYYLAFLSGNFSWIPRRPTIYLHHDASGSIPSDDTSSINIFASTNRLGNFDGASLALSFDGSVLAVGHEDWVRMYKFSTESDSWEALGDDLQLDGLVLGGGSNDDAVLDGPTCDHTVSIALSRDGQTVAVASRTAGVVAVYKYGPNLDAMREEWSLVGRPWEIDAKDCWGHHVALSADGKVLATGASGQIQVLEWNTETEEWQVTGPNIPGRFFSLEPNGEYLATKTRAGEILVLTFVP